MEQLRQYGNYCIFHDKFLKDATAQIVFSPHSGQKTAKGPGGKCCEFSCQSRVVHSRAIPSRIIRQSAPSCNLSCARLFMWDALH